MHLGVFQLHSADIWARSYRRTHFGQKLLVLMTSDDFVISKFSTFYFSASLDDQAELLDNFLHECCYYACGCKMSQSRMTVKDHSFH